MRFELAVIVPCYNYGAYVKETVASVLASTYNNYEIIIVDDGSTDPHTIKILDELNNVNRVRVIRQDNAGLSAARNAGIKATNAKYILTLDADDLIDPTFIEKGVWLLEKYSEYAYVYPLVQLFGELTRVWRTLPFNYDYLKIRNFIPATIIIRRSAWERVDGYDESMREGFEDWEFLIRLGKHGLVGLHMNEILFFYRKHPGSMLEGSKKKQLMLRQVIRSKHPDIYSIAALFKAILVFGIIEIRLRSKSKYKILKERVLRIVPVQYKEQLKKMIISKRRESTPSYTFKSIEQRRNTNNNVLIVLPWLQIGGVETVFLNVVESLMNDYNFYVVLTAQSDNQAMKDEFKDKVKAVYDISSFSSKNKDKSDFFIHIIDRHNISIVHISNSQLGYDLIPTIKEKCPSMRIIDTLHMEEPWAAWDYFSYSKRFSKLIDTRVVLTQSQKKRLISENEFQDIRVIPNGIRVDEAKENVDNSKHDFTIGFIGRLVAQKDPLLFIRTADVILSRGIQMRFVIVGSGPLESSVKKEIIRRNLSNHMKMIGATRKIKSIFDEIDILCAPSLREGLPMIGLEAMESHVPIIATDVPGWNDLIKNEFNGLLANPDADSLADQCIKLYTDRELLRQIADKARECVIGIYSVEKMANEYKCIYDQVEK